MAVEPRRAYARRMMIFRRAFSEHLLRWRRSAGLSQEEAASALRDAGLFWEQRMVSQVERGERSGWTFEAVVCLSIASGTPIREMLSGTAPFMSSTTGGTIPREAVLDALR